MHTHTFNLVKIKRVDSLNFASKFIRWKFSWQWEWNEEQSPARKGGEEVEKTSKRRTRHESKDVFGIFVIYAKDFDRAALGNAISRNCETIGSVES